MRHAHRSGAGQGGQALVLGMLLAGLLSIALLRYFFVGQVAGARARQLHALDAAAYSGALVQARAFNMLAHINRSQVAHQVAIAHLATLASWASFGATEASRLARGNPPAYLIALQFGPAHGMAYRAAARAAGLRGAGGSHGELAAAYLEHERIVHDVLLAAQEAIVSSLEQTRNQVVREVLARNYPGSAPAQFDLQFEDDTLPGYVQRFPGSRRVKHGLRDLVMSAAGHYHFLASRDAVAYNPWLVQPGCPHLRHELRRQGATLLNDRGVWQSVDTHSFHALRAVRKVLCYYRAYPMAWAWVQSGNARFMSGQHVPAPNGLSASEFWRTIRKVHGALVPGSYGNRQADRLARTQRSRWPARGLPDYYDIPASRAGQTPRFAVTLRHSGPDGLSIVTRSVAESFFARPTARADGRHERPHLFHPYWQARLAPSRVMRRRVRPSLSRPRWASQHGQALAESMVALLLLLALWQALGWVGRLQDIALSAQHASRFAAFIATRTPRPVPDPAAAQAAPAYFDGPAHQWRSPSGRPMVHAGSLHGRPPEAGLLSDAEVVRLQMIPQAKLPVHTQPGGRHLQARVLRGDWLKDTGMLMTRVEAPVGFSPFEEAAAPVLARQTAILYGAGHAGSDAESQRAIARARMAWRRAARHSTAAGRRITRMMAPVDAAWRRPAPDLDWTSPWVSRVPAALLQDEPVRAHAGLRRYGPVRNHMQRG